MPWLYESTKTRLSHLFPAGTRINPRSIYGFTDPVDGDFSWFNQGTASVDTTGDGILLTPPKDSTDNLRGREITAPSTPYTVTAAFSLNGGPGTFNGGGMFWRQSSDSKLIFIHLRGTTTGGTVEMNVYKLSNATTFSSSVAGFAPINWVTPGLFWLRLTDNGTNRLAYLSNNGIDWTDPFYTESRTTFMTADRIGFAVNNLNANYATKLRLLHWKQT